MYINTPLYLTRNSCDHSYKDTELLHSCPDLPLGPCNQCWLCDFRCCTVVCSQEMIQIPGLYSCYCEEQNTEQLRGIKTAFVRGESSKLLNLLTHLSQADFP